MLSHWLRFFLLADHSLTFCESQADSAEHEVSAEDPRSPLLVVCCTKEVSWAEHSLLFGSLSGQDQLHEALHAECACDAKASETFDTQKPGISSTYWNPVNPTGCALLPPLMFPEEIASAKAEWQFMMHTF